MEEQNEGRDERDITEGREGRFADIPFLPLYQILSLLSWRDVLRCAGVCSRWRSVGAFASRHDPASVFCIALSKQPFYLSAHTYENTDRYDA